MHGQRRCGTQHRCSEKLGRRKFWMKQLLMPQILAAAMLLGMFHWTNYWDFVIYYVVTGGTLLFMNIICLKGDIRQILAVTDSTGNRNLCHWQR